MMRIGAFVEFIFKLAYALCVNLLFGDLLSCSVARVLFNVIVTAIR